mmetsp:Transcript_119276/g.385109  ORF Transcript_119276/g.385109 Transcript_119276/m.385109 type:complete len:220 (+) Transcript_119276:727-1386(+)
MLMSETAAASISLSFFFFSLTTPSSAFRFLAASSCSCLFSSICAASSSTESLNFPHSRDMRSWRRPQLGLPSVHFFHWPPSAGPSCTGDTAAAKVGTAVVVVLLSSGCFSCNNATLSCIWPRTCCKAFFASGVIIRSILLCNFWSSKRNSNPSELLQIFGLGLAWPICSKVMSSHAVSPRMKSNTTRSFFRIWSSVLSSKLVVAYPWSSVSRMPSVSFR